jgi:hypothetical protein
LPAVIDCRKLASRREVERSSTDTMTTNADVETVQGTVASLSRRNTSNGVIFEFQVQLALAGARRVRWQTSHEATLREGDTVAATGSVDSNGIIDAQTVVRIVPVARVAGSPLWVWLTLPAVVLLAQWIVEDAASTGNSVWDETWRWARERLSSSIFEATNRGPEDQWVFWLVLGLGVVGASTRIRPRHIALFLRAAGATIALTALLCWLSAWDWLMVARLSLISCAAACAAYAVYLRSTERRRILDEPPVWPPLWWLLLPAIGGVVGWLIVIAILQNVLVNQVWLLVAGLAVFLAAAKMRPAPFRLVIQAIGGAIALLGLNNRDMFPTPALLFSLIICCPLVAASLGLYRVVRRKLHLEPD